MAEYLIQDTTLAAIGDAIRAKEESSDPIPVSEFASRIAAIETGVTVQRASGTFTTNNSGNATVNCGFRPDLVFIQIDEKDGNYPLSCAAAFAEEARSGSMEIHMIALSDSGDTGWLEEFVMARTTTGFSATVKYYNVDDFSETGTEKNATFNYTAVKYT